MLSYGFVLVLFFFSCGERCLSIAALCGEIRSSEKVLAEAELRREELEADYARACDPAYLTEKMRELGYIYPGETMYLGLGAD